MPNCACGCDQPARGGRYLPGHDQKLRARLEERVDGLPGLARLVDAAENFVGNKVSLEELGRRVKAAFRRWYPQRR